MQQYKLGEICTIIKGTTGIKKAIPGEHPLVVTAENRLSSNEYQFDTKAVCIPLVSSTGHGHASLKRLHYQEGKFALGNILAAVIPNDENLLNAEYLYYYLTFYKDSKIVPLMKGAANVSLTINSIKTITIDIPEIDQQLKVVNTIKKSQIELKKINQKNQEQNNYIADLRTSILQYAVQGKLVAQNPQDEPTSELLKCIKAEKEQLIKDGKIQKEKFLPSITQDEIPYELPQGWKWVRISDLFIFKNGLSYKKDCLNIKSNSMIRVLRGGNIFNLSYTLKSDDINISKEFVKPGLLLKKGYLITPAVTSLEHIGKFAYIEKDYNDIVVGGFVMMFLPISIQVYSRLFLYFFSSFYVRKIMRQITNKSGQALYNISKEKLKMLLIPLPPLAEQKRIVAKVDELMKICEELEKENNIAQKLSSELFQSVMQKCFTPKASSNKIIDLKLKRAILSAKIINELYEEKYFGAVKLEKILYLCETHLGVTLNGKYKKEAAGPYDAQSRYEIEGILKNKKWFDVNKEQKSAIANFYISGEMGFKIDMFTKMGANWPVRPFIDISILDFGYSFTHGIRFVPLPRLAVGVAF